jgi:Zn-dependent M28 family amino/carboxypeptidase
VKAKAFPARLGVFIGVVVLGVAAVAVGGLTNLARPEKPFSGEQAMLDLTYQVNLGPRIPGSAAHEKMVQWLVDTLGNAGWTVSKQETTRMDHAVINVIAKRGSGSPWVILGAHYDSRLWATQETDPAKAKEPVPGANDGASGVAVLTELARSLPGNLPGQVWLVFFDAEDNGEIPGWDWLLGSEAFVDSLEAKPDAAVVLDMIGDANLDIYEERNSDKELNQQIWDTAARLGYGSQFIQNYKFSMLDDHTPFLNAGIRAVDIIDFDYPSWHTTQDTIDKTSASSLKAVGDTIQAWLIQEQKSKP